MYVLKQILRATPNFPNEQVVTVAEWDDRPTLDDLVALDVSVVAAERLLQDGMNSRNMPFLLLHYSGEKLLDNPDA